MSDTFFDLDADPVTEKGVRLDVNGSFHHMRESCIRLNMKMIGLSFPKFGHWLARMTRLIRGE